MIIFYILKFRIIKEIKKNNLEKIKEKYNIYLKLSNMTNTKNTNILLNFQIFIIITPDKIYIIITQNK